MDVQAGVAVTGDLGTLLDDLADIDIDSLSNTDNITVQDAEDIISLATRLTSIDDDGNAILFDANVGTSVQLGNWGIGARMWARCGPGARLGLGKPWPRLR